VIQDSNHPDGIGNPNQFFFVFAFTDTNFPRFKHQEFQPMQRQRELSRRQ